MLQSTLVLENIPNNVLKYEAVVAINFGARKFTKKCTKYEPVPRFQIDQIAIISCNQLCVLDRKFTKKCAIV